MQVAPVVTSLNQSNPQFPGWPVFAEDEIEAAVRVLRSGKVNYWTGEEGRLFESEFAAYVSCPYAVAVANGTVALELALHALGIGPGDEVVVTPRTFVASASCVVMRGAIPVFADVDAESGNITAETISKVLSNRTRAVIVVHLAGWPCDMDPILKLTESRGIKVIEDCAQAHGATYKGRQVGSLGFIGAFSFCQDKILTTGGEGGMVTTHDKSIWERMWSFKDHGKSYEAVYHRKHAPGFRWLHESFGTNWRITEIQSAIGRVILRKLPDWLQIRKRNADLLKRAIEPFASVRIPRPNSDDSHSYYKFYCYIRQEHLAEGWSRDRIMAEINALGVPCFSGSCSEIYLESAFSSASLQPKDRLPVTRSLGESSLMFLVHPTLDEQHMTRIGQAAASVLGRATN